MLQLITAFFPAMSHSDSVDQNIATLVHPDEYGRHYNQIAVIRTRHIVVVKRKLLSASGCELVRIMLDDDAAIIYRVKWALVPMLFGALLVAGILAVLVFGSVEGGTEVPVGALAFALILGGVLVTGPKRHIVTVTTQGKTYRWKSRGGDFKYKIASTQRVIAFAQERSGT
ncbi:hypothetical protein INH39_29065 [Massilia violaceinigra]|uniref:Uncharacterized protein n=1 Tax=Massilia violaceinigra TaxID=2045208 RepID=A0ABY4A443_9BURK|nr:hypothetical protein [Massilia violaceinigra]UOD29412.1 hypothetical protein INH39_29065 [Massilia violaceinigra]